MFWVVCFLVSSPRTSCTYRTLYIHSVNRDVFVSNATRSRWSSWNCCMIEETCLWREWCPSTMVERVEQITLWSWCGSDTSWPMWLCVVLKRVTLNWEQNVLYTRAWHKWHFTWIVCAMTGRCSIWEHVGSHWRKPGKSVAGIIKKILWMMFFGNNGTEMEQRVLARLTRKQFSSWFRKNGMTCSSQDKEFVGWGIFNQDQASRLAKNRLLKNWRRNTQDLHFTPTMHTRHSSLRGQKKGYKAGRSSSVATSFPDVLQRQFLQQLVMWRLLHKLARQLKSQPVKLQFWALTGPLRIIGFLDASYGNNEDGSSQSGMTDFF